MRLRDKPPTESERIAALEQRNLELERKVIDLQQAVTMLMERLQRGGGG